MDPKPFTYEHFIQAVQSLKDDMLMYYIDELAPYQGMIHTITADNGKEFARNKDITEIEWKLNHRPRKSLGYLTPLEYFKKLYNFDYGSRCTSI